MANHGPVWPCKLLLRRFALFHGICSRFDWEITEYNQWNGVLALTGVNWFGKSDQIRIENIIWYQWPVSTGIIGHHHREIINIKRRPIGKENSHKRIRNSAGAPSVDFEVIGLFWPITSDARSRMKRETTKIYNNKSNTRKWMEEENFLIWGLMWQ